MPRRKKAKFGIIPRTNVEEIKEKLSCIVGENCVIQWSGMRHEIGVDCRPQALMGEFKCENPQCRHVWMSGKITGLVYAIRNAEDSLTIGLLYYLQDCQRCNSLGTLIGELDSENVDRVLSKITLILGLRGRVFAIPDPGKKTKPHDKRNCHACKDGHCVVKLSEDLESFIV